MPLKRFKRVPSSINGHGINAKKPSTFTGFSDWTSRNQTKCSKRSSSVSICPNIIVAEVVILSLCAARITSNHSCPVHLPREINLRTLSFNISAPAPGKLSIPLSFKALNTSVCDLPSNLQMCATSGGPKACKRILGYNDFNSLNKFV